MLKELVNSRSKDAVKDIVSRYETDKPMFAHKFSFDVDQDNLLAKVKFTAFTSDESMIQVQQESGDYEWHVTKKKVSE